MRGETFLGTDFNYEDLGLEELDYQRHTLLGEATVQGRSCYRVESLPDRGSWYSKIIRCIDKKDYLPRNTEYYDSAGGLSKVRTLDHIEEVASYATATVMTMRSVQVNTSTRIKLTNIEYDTDLPDGVFEGP